MNVNCASPFRLLNWSQVLNRTHVARISRPRAGGMPIQIESTWGWSRQNFLISWARVLLSTSFGSVLKNKFWITATMWTQGIGRSKARNGSVETALQDVLWCAMVGRWVAWRLWTTALFLQPINAADGFTGVWFGGRTPRSKSSMPNSL